MNNSVKTEILSPAGSIQALYAGIQAGADAVYIGGGKFGARAYADNPEEEQLLDAIDYVHLHGKKIYLTVNTLLKNLEIEEQLYQYLSRFYEYGLDAVIVQDLGVFHFIRENFPGLELHASTQMVITGVNGAALLKEMGASRIVTAREVSLNEIRKIRDNVDIEIESFIHGAMCYSYSGQCLFSSILGGRSGNRGRCAGPCRQPYSVYENGRLCNDADSQYVLSLRDMNTLSILPQIIQSGVYSLKIEGRMKSPEYAAGTVELYRKYVDLYHSFSSDEEAAEKYSIQKADIEKLAGLYSRSGSGTGYYTMHNSKSMVSVKKPAYRTDCEDYVSELTEKYINTQKKYQCKAKVELKCGEKSKLILTDNFGHSVEEEGELVSAAKNRPMTKEDIQKQIAKTGSTPFEFTNIDIQMEEGIFIPNKQLNELRRKGIDTLWQDLLMGYRRKLTGNQTEMSHLPYRKEKPDINCYITSEEQLDIVIQNEMIKEISISTDGFSGQTLMKQIDRCIAAEKKTIVALPFIFREKAIQYFENIISELKERYDTGKLSFMVRNVDEIGYLKQNNISHFITDYLVYAFNQSAVKCLTELGAERITYPYELNYNELRNNPIPNGEIIVYGKIPLMISANCLNQTIGKCDKKEKQIVIRDRLEKDFPVVNVCNYCYNIIYNNYPLSLFGTSHKVCNLYPQTVRVSLTTENRTETKEILEHCISTFCQNETRMEEETYTRGHFNRGVE